MIFRRKSWELSTTLKTGTAVGRTRQPSKRCGTPTRLSNIWDNRRGRRESLNTRESKWKRSSKGLNNRKAISWPQKSVNFKLKYSLNFVDKQRTEYILGSSHLNLYLNEVQSSCRPTPHTEYMRFHYIYILITYFKCFCLSLNHLNSNNYININSKLFLNPFFIKFRDISIEYKIIY